MSEARSSNLLTSFVKIRREFKALRGLIEVPTMLIHPPLVENRMTKEEAFEIVDGLPTMKGLQVVDLAEAYLEYTEEEIAAIYYTHLSYTGQMVSLAKTISTNLRRSEIRDIRNHVVGTKLGVK